LENLILWESNTEFLPRDPKERFKLHMQMLEAVKADIDSGVHSAWGMSPGGSSGYAISKLQGEKLFMALSKFSPNISFTVEPMLSIDETISSMKQMQKQAR
jgi:hypothetical protein